MLKKYHSGHRSRRIVAQYYEMTLPRYAFSINVTRPTKCFGITYWLAMTFRPMSLFPSTIVYLTDGRVGSVCRCHFFVEGVI